MPASPDLLARKTTLRKEALARRGTLSEVERIEKSLALAESADDLPLPPECIVAGFWPIRDEVDTRPLMATLRQRGHALCLPVVAKPHLIFRRLDRETELVPVGFGTVAPGPESEILRPDVLLVPLAAFDAAGNRMGYGKGHYDTAIAALSKDGPLLCIGLAFAIQEVDEVPVEAHDKPLHGILTENGYRPFSARG